MHLSISLLLLSLPLLVKSLAIPQVPLIRPAILRIIDSDESSPPQPSHSAERAYDASVGRDSIFSDVVVEDKARKIKRSKAGRKIKGVVAEKSVLTGDLTYSAPGPTACEDLPTTASITLPSTSFSPTSCGRKVRVTLGSTTFDGIVSDRGEGFKEGDVGVSAEAFLDLVGSLEGGRVAGVEWIYLE